MAAVDCNISIKANLSLFALRASFSVCVVLLLLVFGVCVGGGGGVGSASSLLTG